MRARIPLALASLLIGAACVGGGDILPAAPTVVPTTTTTTATTKSNQAHANTNKYKNDKRKEPARNDIVRSDGDVSNTCNKGGDGTTTNHTNHDTTCNHISTNTTTKPAHVEAMTARQAGKT